MPYILLYKNNTLHLFHEIIYQFKTLDSTMWLISLFLTSILTFVELNCENLFDCQHDSLKLDTEYLPQGAKRWTPYRYWRKIDNIAKEIISCGKDSCGYSLPDIVALCEVENDSVMRDLTMRSALRTLHYDYLMTNSPDLRGIDVALMYHTYSFKPISHSCIRINPLKGMRPTRDILYVCGQIVSGDTLHIFVVHAPSRYGGERKTRPYRLAVVQQLNSTIDSIRCIQPTAKIIVAGDFNDYSNSASIEYLKNCNLVEVSANAEGKHIAKGSYYFKGEWENIDHVFISPNLRRYWVTTYIHDMPFLLEEDTVFGIYKPFRTYQGYKYQEGGFSDHLPVVTRFAF